MTQNHVYIKDLPYDFLKDQEPGFFESDQYKKMTELFDSKAKEAPLLEAKPEEPGVPQVIIDYLKVFTARRYLQEPVIVEDETDLTCFIFIRMTSKVGVQAKRDERVLRQITQDLKTLPPLEPSVIRRSIESMAIRRFKNASKDKILLPVPTVTGLRPDKTANVVKDVIDASKFYQSVPSPEVFDDVKYRINKINDAIQDAAMPITPFSTGVERIRDHLNEEVTYEFKFDDLKKTVELIRKAVIDKYLSTYDSQQNLAVDPKELRESILLGARSLIKDRPRFALYRYDSAESGSPSPNHLLFHRLNSANMIAGTLIKGVSDRYENLPVKAQSVNVASVELKTSANIVTILLADTKTNDPIDLSLLMNDPVIKVRRIAFDRPSDTWYLDFDDLDDGMILQYVINDDEIRKPTAVNYLSTSRVALTFPQPVSGEVYLVAGSENVFTNSDIVISDENVVNVLQSTNFFNKAFKLWKS
jgi:hypothetical protein